MLVKSHGSVDIHNMPFEAALKTQTCRMAIGRGLTTDNHPFSASILPHFPLNTSPNPISSLQTNKAKISVSVTSAKVKTCCISIVLIRFYSGSSSVRSWHFEFPWSEVQ